MAGERGAHPAGDGGELVILQAGGHLIAARPRREFTDGELGWYFVWALQAGGWSAWCGWCLDCGMLVVIPAESLQQSREGPHQRHG